MKRAALLAACILFLATGAAQAALLEVGSNYTTIIHMEKNGANWDYGGGSFDISKLDGVSLAYAYCVDFVHTITPGNSYAATVTYNGYIHNNLVDHADQVAWLLKEYGSDADVNEAALQAAIWHVIAPTTYALDFDNYGPTNSTRLSYLGYLSGLPTSAEINDDILGSFYWISPTGNYRDLKQGFVAPTPVPGTLLLLGSGLAGLVGIARFRKKRQAE